jgi:hypothetical protein
MWAMMPQRKRKLPISFSGQAAPKFKPYAAFWAQCDIAYGHAISREIREELVAATNKFLWFASMEAETEDLNAAVKRIGRYRTAAGALLNELAEPGSTASIFHADYLIQSEFPDATLDQLHDLVMSYYGACARAERLAASKNEPEFRQGDAWNGWIRRLTAILKQHGLPITVRHDDEGRPSRFLLLVRELQKGFPAQYRRGARSDKATDKALETAIGRTRRFTKAAKK